MLDINKIYLGDCLDIMRQIPDKSVDVVVCDLPYGITGCKWDTVIPLDLLWKQYNRVSDSFILFASSPFTCVLGASNIENLKYSLVWNKRQTGNPFLAKRQPLKIHEDILIFGSPVYLPKMRKGKMRKKGGGSKSLIFGNTDLKENDLYYPTSIFEFPNCSNRTGRLHPTQKPVELIEYIIENFSIPGATVLDNCIGSGTTAIACINTGRNFIGIEKDKTYYDTAVSRVHARINQAEKR